MSSSEAGSREEEASSRNTNCGSPAAVVGQSMEQWRGGGGTKEDPRHAEELLLPLGEGGRCVSYDTVEEHLGSHGGASPLTGLATALALCEPPSLLELQSHLPQEDPDVASLAEGFHDAALAQRLQR